MSNISGFGAMRRKQEEDEKRQELYAGGVDNRGSGSGLAVLGPPGNPTSRGPANVFDNIVSQAGNPSSHEGEGPAPGGPNCRRITLYRNGFTIDDGPLRDLTSPESKAFIATLEAGRVPAELATPPPANAPAPRGPIQVDIHLDDKRGEDYVAPPPPAYIAYSGTGNTLRSEASSSSSSSNHVFTSDMLSSVAATAVDDSQPSTTLKVVLPDGKKKAIKINQNSTVLHLAAVIERECAPGGPFVLSAGFPPVDLTDHNTTMAEAKLLGAAVTVKRV